MDVKINRRIPASAETVYRAWTDPKQIAKWQGGKLIAEIVVDGLWFWEHHTDSGKKVPHYGRYVALEPNARIATTWMSKGTNGLESHRIGGICQSIYQVTKNFRPAEIFALHQREQASCSQLWRCIFLAAPHRFHLNVA